MVKYRQIPNDFIVEELSSFEVKKSGKYRLYILEKSGIETFYLISHISKKNNIPSKAIGIAGLKDKHAVTKQYMTIPAKYNIDEAIDETDKTNRNAKSNEKNLKITFLGFVDEEIRPGDLTGNKFIVTVRDIKKGELEGIKTKAQRIAKDGVPNYFDSQRFGSVIQGTFIAKHIVLSDYENAVKIYLTGYTKSESKKVKDEKRYIFENWKNISKLNMSEMHFEPQLRNVLEEYKKKGEFLLAYKQIPAKLREMYVSAYQSYIWNECVKTFLWQNLEKKSLYSVEYACGNLVYYKNFNLLNDDVLDDKKSDDDRNKDNEKSNDKTLDGETKLQKSFHLIGPEMKATDAEQSIISKVLLKEGVKLKDFDIKEKTGNFFKPAPRDIFVYPSDFSITDPATDELNDKGKNNIFKITISFSLPKGSYATIVTKRLFNQ